MNRIVKSPFDEFAAELVREQVNPETLAQAKEWYKAFTGSHAVKMEDRELIEIYQTLH